LSAGRLDFRPRSLIHEAGTSSKTSIDINRCRELRMRDLFGFFCSDYLAVYHRVCVDFRLFGTLYLARTHHGLRGSVSPVLTETGLVDGRWQFSTPQNPHPLTNHQKIFGTDNYVGNPRGCAKFGANPPIGGFWANG